MKRTDIAMIILVASLSVMTAYLIVGSLPFFKDVNKPVKVQVAQPISPDFHEKENIDSSIFNKDAINPTVEISIGSSPTQGQ